MKWSMKQASRLSRVLISQMNLYIKFEQEVNVNCEYKLRKMGRRKSLGGGSPIRRLIQM